MVKRVNSKVLFAVGDDPGLDGVVLYIFFSMCLVWLGVIDLLWLLRRKEENVCQFSSVRGVCFCGRGRKVKCNMVSGREALFVSNVTDYGSMFKVFSGGIGGLFGVVVFKRASIISVLSILSFLSYVIVCDIKVFRLV